MINQPVNLLGIDGRVPATALPLDGCCPPSLCQLDQDGLICNFVQQLPSGPLWDRPKLEALSNGFTEGEKPDDWCPTMVDHAIYTARRLIDGLMNALWPAIRESSPFTARATLDEWLLRFGWKDCYDGACREADHPIPSPIEIRVGNEYIAVDPGYPEDLRCAVKRGIVVALARLAVGPRRNIDAINFVIAPLGARIEPSCYRDLELDPQQCDNDDGTTACDGEPLEDPDCIVDDTDPYKCPAPECRGHDTPGAQCGPTMRQFEFCVAPSGDFMPACPPTACDDALMQPFMTGSYNWAMGAPFVGDVVQAYYEPAKNLITQTQDFAHSDWFRYQASIVSDVALAPDGTLTADKMIEDTSAAGAHGAGISTLTLTANKYTFSIFAHAAERPWTALELRATDFGPYNIAYFNLATGTKGTLVAADGYTSHDIEDVGDGWYRCSITVMATAESWALATEVSLANNYVYDGDGVSGVYIWGAQLELGGKATTYVARQGKALEVPYTLPDRVYPGVMAAECIVRAMLPRGAKTKVKLCV